MLSMVSHMSVKDCGGNLPYPMQSMCDMALKRAHEYCSSQNESWKKKKKKKRKKEKKEKK